MFSKFFTFSLSAFIALVFTAVSFGQPEPLMSLTHTPGDLNASIFNNGSIGHDTIPGAGVSWKGTDGCFAGGTLFGTSSRMSINGNMFSFPNQGGTGPIQDIQNVSSNFARGFMSDPDFDQITEAILDDSLAPSPYGVEITQKTYSTTGDEFVFIRYGFKNTTGSTLSNSVGGIFVDWDINNLNSNSGGHSLSDNVSYIFGTVPGDYYYGIVALDGASGMRVTGTLGAMSEDSLRALSYNFITTFEPFIEPNGDLRSWIGTSLGDIVADSTVWATFAVVAGDNLTQLNTNALNASFKSDTMGWTNYLFFGIYPVTEPSIADFGDIEKNTSSQFLTIILSNWGSDNLIVSNIATSVGPFTLESNLNYPITLSTFESVEVEVIFSPVAAGDYDEILAVTSNEPGFEGFHLVGQGYEILEAFTNIFYASSGPGNNGDIVTVNKQTGSGTLLGSSLFSLISSLTVDPTSNIMYGLVAGSNDLVRVNAGGGDSYRLSTIELPVLSAIAFDNTGILYASQQTGDIYTIDLSDGSYTIVETAEVQINAIAFHPTTGELWGARRVIIGSGKDEIYTIDLSNGTSNLIGETGFGTLTNDLAFDEMGNLYGIIGTANEIGKLISISTTDASGTNIGEIGFNDITGLAYSLNGPVIISVENETELIPEEYSLKQNYPNPFNPVTTIRYQIPELSFVTIKVYDVLGGEIIALVNEEKSIGSYEIGFDATNLPSGIYFYRLQAGQYMETKKMMYLK